MTALGKINVGAQGGGMTLGQGATWNTAVAAAAGEGLKVLSYTPKGGQESLVNDEVGHPAGTAPDIGNESWEVDVDGDCRYGALRFLAYIFGDAETPSGAGPYLHDLNWKETLTKFGTLCLGVREGAAPWEIASAKCTKIVLSFADGQKLKFKLTFRGSSRARASSTNSNAVFLAATAPDGIQQVMGTHATFWINAQSGGDFGNGDKVKLRAWELTLERPFPPLAEHETESIAMPEPFEDGKIMVSFRATLRSYEDDTYYAFWENLQKPTALKARIKFLSSSGTTYYLKFDFPNVTLAKSPETAVAGPGRVPHVLDFNCYAGSDIGGTTPPTGMTALGPVEAFIQDARATAYLT